MKKLIILIAVVAIVVTSFAFISHKKVYIHDDGLHCYDRASDRNYDHSAKIVYLAGYTITSDTYTQYEGWEGTMVYCYHIYYK